MKIALVCPIFMSRKNKGYYETDRYYDHPTPIDEKGTVGRMLESSKILKNQKFTFILVSGGTASDIEDDVDEAGKKLIEESNYNIDTIYYSYKKHRKLVEFYKKNNKEYLLPTIQMYGYSELRNMCLILSHIYEMDLAISVDDDCIFMQEDYINTIIEDSEKEFNGKKMDAFCGPYVIPETGLHYKESGKLWTHFWPTTQVLNQVVDKYIIPEPRYKEVPFAIMGNMIVSKKFYTQIPLDPLALRGEDMDWMLNGKLFGFDFILDKNLNIKHDAPSRPHEPWKPLREDIYRFLYIRDKIKLSAESDEVKTVTVEEFCPYPGEFYKDDIEQKFTQTQTIMALEYLSKNDNKNAAECLKNIQLMYTDAIPKKNALDSFLEFRKLWIESMHFIDEKRVELQELLK